MPQQQLAATSATRHAFLTALDPLRPQLYRFCRRLTGTVWDAEDLVQETLTRAFTRAAQSHQPVQRPMAWLARIATNAYIDSLRRAAPTAPGPSRAGDTCGRRPGGSTRRPRGGHHPPPPPQERAALVLKDVFDLPLKEIAAMLSTSEGAVKAALQPRTRSAERARP